MAALKYDLPQAEVTHSDLLALSSLEPASGQLCRALRSLANVGLPLPPNLADNELFESWSEQKIWSTLQDEFNATILDETLSPRDRKLRELFSGSQAGRWLACPTPKYPAELWSSDEWQTLLRWRLGLPMGLTEFCAFCGSAQDDYGDHALCCKSNGVYGRHNALRDAVADLLRECGCECCTDIPLPGSTLVPADIFTPSFPGEAAMALDTSVVHPLQPSQSANATVYAGAAAQKREADKVVYYSDHCSRRSWGFTAFVGETTGAWGQAAQRCVRALARAKSLRSGEDAQEVAHAMWDSVSRAVASSVARQLVRARVCSGALRKGPEPPRATAASRRNACPSLRAQSASGALDSGALNGSGPAAGDLLLARALCE
jgi:hypothetical protein